MFFSRVSSSDATIMAAVDAAKANVMIADAAFNIVYMNPSVRALLKEAEAEIRRDLPSFDASSLVGKNIDVFHKNPAHQRHVLGELTKTHQVMIEVGGRRFDLSATPLRDGKGMRIGTLVEWSDAKARIDNLDYERQLAAVGRSQATIEFKLDGTIVTANQNFLDALGYTMAEIEGRNHSMFVEPSYRESAEYKQFWAALNRGEFQAAEFKRIGKGGREVWIQASYNPILDLNGRPYKVVKFATDVTERKLETANFIGQIDAINKAQAVIEFNLDGTVITANENFLHALGYSLSEIQGRHHSMFIDPAYRDSSEYREFWAALNRGEYQAAEYMRIGKGGREVWIQASYNPILDLNGKPYKVVKFATDVTPQVIARKKAEHVRGMMENVAAGAEELNASVKEISEAMARSRDKANDASTRVEATDNATQRLSEVATSMGGIVQVISDITGQINLLALNATIESARAGEAGRGFAVVANEVKNLANQAKSATERISDEIDGMRNVSNDVIGGLRNIKEAIESVREYVTSTATAVEEQSAVASEMSNNMQIAASEATSIGG